MSEHPYIKGRKGDQPTLAPWMVMATQTIIDMRKVVTVGPVFSGGTYNKYTVTFVGGSQLEIWDNGCMDAAAPIMKRAAFVGAWALGAQSGP